MSGARHREVYSRTFRLSKSSKRAFSNDFSANFLRDDNARRYYSRFNGDFIHRRPRKHVPRAVLKVIYAFVKRNTRRRSSISFMFFRSFNSRCTRQKHNANTRISRRFDGSRLVDDPRPNHYYLHLFTRRPRFRFPVGDVSAIRFAVIGSWPIHSNHSDRSSFN